MEMLPIPAIYNKRAEDFKDVKWSCQHWNLNRVSVTACNDSQALFDLRLSELPSTLSRNSRHYPLTLMLLPSEPPGPHPPINHHPDEDNLFPYLANILPHRNLKIGTL
ncbi:hypothetical protein RF11_08219 [Thelohanellus kitauei]|uniref:Uncharacterized protein n=1 Tax=Thelohanellus kitauei TaxID=669202 RepID=A0A0C2NII5_THEKT|nr:hypothetical protein RF11_08219 [Thelohanellus kitauei]